VSVRAYDDADQCIYELGQVCSGAQVIGGRFRHLVLAGQVALTLWLRGWIRKCDLQAPQRRAPAVRDPAVMVLRPDTTPEATWQDGSEL
jgi:hypothetical protein